MNERAAFYVLAMHGVIALGVVIAATVLCFHGSLDASATTGIIGAALGFAGGTASSLGSLGAIVNGKSVVTPQLLAEQGATMRTALVSTASSSAEAVQPVVVTPSETGT